MATLINGPDASDADGNDAPSCFMCLGRTVESGEPLRRGTRGYVHHSCLVKFIREKEEQGYNIFLLRRVCKVANKLTSIVGEETILHSILLVVLKLSLLCLGYSMALHQ